MHTTIGPTHHQIAELLSDDIISEMTRYLIEDYNYPLEKAMNIVYRSATVKLLLNEEAELYVQSPAYVYDLLLQELNQDKDC